MELIFRGPQFLSVAIVLLGLAQAFRSYLIAPSRSWVLFALRGATFGLLGIVMAQPTIQWKLQSEAGSPIVAIFDDTASISPEMDLRLHLPVLAEISQRNRVQLYLGRATGLVSIGELSPIRGPIAEQLATIEERLGHEIGTDVASGRDASQAPFWVAPQKNASPIADWLLDGTQGSSELAGPSVGDSVVLLFSDGQVNAGKPISEVARTLKSSGARVYPCVSDVGAPVQDLALTGIDMPVVHFASGTIQGTLVLRDGVPGGRPFDVQISHRGKPIWETRLYTDGSGSRSVQFRFPAAAALALVNTPALPSDGAESKIVNLECSLRSRIPSDILSNNQQSKSIVISGQSSRVLLVDSRPRWETRYIRNLFRRDPAWELNSITTSKLANQRQRWEEINFAEVDLVIWGDSSPDLLTETQNQAMASAVRAGTGLIFIDGKEGNLRSNQTNFAELLPIQEHVPVLPNRSASTEPDSMAEDDHLLKVNAGDDFAPLEFCSRESWSKLPGFRDFALVRPKLSAEVLLVAENFGSQQPLLLKSISGRGKILYWATDQTWRWRYRHADSFHGRLWNQLAGWAARPPPNAEDAVLSIYVDSLHAIAPTAGICEPIVVACRFRGDLELPNEVVAEVRNGEGKAVERFPMIVQRNEGPDAATTARMKDVERQFSGRATGLPPGDYTIQILAEGFPAQLLSRTARIGVFQLPSTETMNLGTNLAILKKIASETDGRIISSASELSGVLDTVRGSRPDIEEFALWRSWVIFAFVVGLFALELLLRRQRSLV